MVGRQGHWGMPASRPVEEGAVQGLAAGLRGELLRPEEGGYDHEDGPEGVPERRAPRRASGRPAGRIRAP
ncbi:MAG: hypothetical protein K0S15_2319 [Solirubrobacterales bacterium]|jgi:hypothetical protein|nr:hypothetical protein [Solirubrobacterales bacterium]MDF2735855.1 hypothetical protein [Chloroflexota bacterium]MDF2759463.1 hypothetical protein [Thermomicrobiales bacterium]